MAYVDFQNFGGLAAARQVRRTTAVADPGPATCDRLTALEWSVVAIARKDSLGSLRRPGRMATALRVIFNRPNPRLADERLEALRRMAILSWHDGYTVPSHEVRRFLAAGFTPGQYETLVDSIARDRAQRAKASRQAAARVDLGLPTVPAGSAMA